MKDLKIILRMIWDVICGLFISDKERGITISSSADRTVTQLKNKEYLRKYSGKNRYVKCPNNR